MLGVGGGNASAGTFAGLGSEFLPVGALVGNGGGGRFGRFPPPPPPFPPPPPRDEDDMEGVADFANVEDAYACECCLRKSSSTIAGVRNPETRSVAMSTTFAKIFATSSFDSTRRLTLLTDVMTSPTLSPLSRSTSGRSSWITIPFGWTVWERWVVRVRLGEHECPALPFSFLFPRLPSLFFFSSSSSSSTSVLGKADEAEAEAEGAAEHVHRVLLEHVVHLHSPFRPDDCDGG